MPLFLDRLPFHCWIDQTRHRPQEHWSVVLPILLTEPGISTPLAGAVPTPWVLDTGTRGEAFAWRRHLLAAGLDPEKGRRPQPVTITSVLGAREVAPIRKGLLWLVSNVPALKGMPCPLELDPGIPFRDVPAQPDPEFHRPLIGMRALLRARLRVELDFANKTLSIWTPDQAP